ncbi:MAG: type IV toxin-antitoxin system AbiEi family antitoxin domain-containing protein [Ilumatobacteraceae bacterium]
MGAEQTTALMTLAQAQHGAVGVDQLAGIDVTRRWLDNLTRRGVLDRAAPGVYTVAGSTSTWRQRLTVGLLALGDASWVSHEAAAKLHAFDRARDDAVEFTVERTARGRRMPFTVHTTAAVPQIDRVTVDEFRCISATRTRRDLARARVPRARLEAAIDSAVRQGLSAPAAIAKRLDDLRGSGRWGARLLDDLLTDSGGHSMLERRFLELVRTAGLPRPTTQAIHQRGGRTFARVDFLFEPFGVVVEVSGRLGHSSPAERARDAQRRNELQDVGRAVYEYTWEDVTKRPADVERTLTARLHHAGWRR